MQQLQGTFYPHNKNDNWLFLTSEVQALLKEQYNHTRGNKSIIFCTPNFEKKKNKRQKKPEPSHNTLQKKTHHPDLGSTINYV